MAESFVETLEKELIHQQRRRFATRTEVALKIFEYIDGFYNRTRLQSALDDRSPVELEQAPPKRKDVQYEQAFKKSTE